MNIEDHINYWLKTAEHDLDVAESLFSSGKYDWCLFVGHLVLEKVLKAIFVQRSNNQVPPKIHNLIRLANFSNLELSDEQKLFLGDVNEFQLETRYPDYRSNFYTKCTRAFTEKYFTMIKEQYRWLKSQIK